MAKKKAKKKKAESKESNKRRRFEARDLDWTIIAKPLLNDLKEWKEGDPKLIDVVIDLNFKYEGGLSSAKDRTIELIHEASSHLGLSEANRVDSAKKELSQQYLFARLEKELIEEIARRSFYKKKDEAWPFIERPIFMIWPDFEVRALTMKSISTVKADAAHRAFSAGGDDIVWAVLDSGIDGDHLHFKKYDNLAVEKLDPPLHHRDFTAPPVAKTKEDQQLRERLKGLEAEKAGVSKDRESSDVLNQLNAEISKTRAELLELEESTALQDDMGHGTHVAGIIAGMQVVENIEGNGQTAAKENDEKQPEKKLRACTRRRDEQGKVRYNTFEFDEISGMAPRCKLLSIKVLNKDGVGPVSNLLAAIAEIQKINEHGRWLKIHGVNLSVGYDFEPEWFACGQSPLCVEVDRLVKSGVVVVTAAGNTGYGYKETASERGNVASGMMMSINDPGNSHLAITVGSTHREMPHMYGVSFFSSKGPTGDGRLKPDLVAPGERIVSCAAGKKKDKATSKLNVEEPPEYTEDSGTSMAAPHVSGAIAAFLSIRREFIGKPEVVKEIFLSSATDLKRERYLQGNGLVDLMRAIQSL